jgi:hypothetical protein
LIQITDIEQPEAGSRCSERRMGRDVHTGSIHSGAFAVSKPPAAASAIVSTGPQSGMIPVEAMVHIELANRCRW